MVVALNGILMKMFIDTMNESNRLASEKTDRVLLELTRLVEKPLPYWMDDIYAELPREVQERIHWVAVEETELCREKLLGGWVNAHVKATYQGLARTDTAHFEDCLDKKKELIDKYASATMRRFAERQSSVRA